MTEPHLRRLFASDARRAAAAAAVGCALWAPVEVAITLAAADGPIGAATAARFAALALGLAG
ncbi:MAG: hypothetical protein D6689_15215, partial [Deltaproteobacteria bacterium]